MSGGDAIDILEGIGKGATNGLIIGGAFSLIAGGFVIGSETSIGSLMISYGISVSSNMLEVGVIQGKKSYYEGDGFWDVANDINKAMFSNSGSIVIGKPFLFSKPLYGTRVISKVPTIANIFLSFEVEKMFADVSFFTTTKATLLSQASPLGLYISYGIATYQINKLLRAIAEKPDFNNSKWVLY